MFLVPQKQKTATQFAVLDSDLVSFKNNPFKLTPPTVTPEDKNSNIYLLFIYSQYLFTSGGMKGIEDYLFFFDFFTAWLFFAFLIVPRGTGIAVSTGVLLDAFEGIATGVSTG